MKRCSRLLLLEAWVLRSLYVTARARGVDRRATRRSAVQEAVPVTVRRLVLNLRVLNPEIELWRRGVEAAGIHHRLRGDLKVPFTYRVPTIDATEDDKVQEVEEGQREEAEAWPTSLAGSPLGQWTADARRFYARGDMDEDRVAQLEKLGMVWSHYDVAWEEGLSATRGWAAEAGHLLAPTDTVFQDYRVGALFRSRW